MPTRTYNPKDGLAFQGDVMIAPLPKGVSINKDAIEIPLKNGMLILAEGEVTGHHHAFRYGLEGVANFRDDGLARDLAIAYPNQIDRVKLFNDPTTLKILVEKQLVTDASLCIGFIRVEKNAPPLTHDEHDGIIFPPGEYYVAGKREFNTEMRRRVMD